MLAGPTNSPSRIIQSCSGVPGKSEEFRARFKLKKSAGEGVVFDRQEAGWIALWCLFLGGPAFFWVLSRHDGANNAQVIEMMALERTRYERERVYKREENVNNVIESGLQVMREKMKTLENERAAIAAENQVLKAKVEFLPQVPKPSETQPASGLLDKDIL